MDDAQTASASSWQAVGAGSGLDCRDAAGDNLVPSVPVVSERLVLSWTGTESVTDLEITGLTTDARRRIVEV